MIFIVELDTIQFSVPMDIDITKSNSDSPRIIRGYASTPSKDREEEEVIQKGLDISDFLDYGWFNYDHDNTKILGYPNKENTYVDNTGFFVEGELLKGIPLADKIWELALALKKSNAPRKLGFSVEGKILERGNKKKILKAKIFNVAITPNPINPSSTWEAIVKSFCPEGSTIGANQTTEAGYLFRYNENSNGSVLKEESLESSLKKLSFLLEDTEEAEEKRKKLRESLKLQTELTKSETVLYLQIAKGLSRNQALEVYDKLKNLPIKGGMN